MHHFSVEQIKRLALLICLGMSLWACGESSTSNDKNKQANQPPLNTGTVEALPLPKRTGQTTTMFQSLSPKTTGVNFINQIDLKHPRDYLYHGAWACGGVSIGDLNGDNKPDLLLTSGSGQNKLYIQTDSIKFKDVTKESGLSSSDIWSGGSTLADIDNDGDLDIYICNFDSPNLLYINDGHGRFTEQAAQFKLDFHDASLSSTFADYDGDGDLDVLIYMNRYYDPNGRPSTKPIKMVNGKPEVLPQYRKYYHMLEYMPKQYKLEEYGRANRLMRNNGDGTFTDVTKEAGMGRCG